MVSSFIAIGSNIDPQENIKRALNHIESLFKIKNISKIYESKPIGFLEQPNFLNLVIEIETNYEPKHLLDTLLNVERHLKRKRDHKDSPRTIDLDIILYGDREHKEKNLTIPHPRMHLRAFVLKPLCDIDSKITHPTINKSASELLKGCDDQKIREFGRIAIND